MIVMERSERGPPRGEDKLEREGRRLSRFHYNCITTSYIIIRIYVLRYIREIGS
jgi:hypothetical protein